MVAFIIRRFIGMLAVLFAVSVLVFIIFILIPGGDPAERMAGKNPTAQNITNIRKKWGFDRPIYVQYVKMMEKAANGFLPGRHGEYDILSSFQNRQNVAKEIKKGIPATFSLCIGAAMIWLFFGTLIGVFSAVNAGRWSDRLITILALVGISMPVFWVGIVLRYFLAEKPNNPKFPDGEYVPLTVSPVGMGASPDPALVLPLDSLHRLLRARPALEHARHDERGLRSHGARERHLAAAGHDQARAA